MERPFQAYEGDEPYVFVCYAHDDKAFVYPELERLREAGLNLWYDEGISPGSEWSDALAHHIERCAVFLYFVTPRSVVSEHCRREVNFALEQPCGMLAVHLEPTELPSGLKLTLSNRQAILKYDEPLGVYEAKLASAIRDAESQDIQEASASTLGVADWTLDVGTQRLTRGEETHELDPKALSVLLHLVDRAPEVVSREGLIDRTWPDVVVGENVLDQAITQLRRALGDDARTPRYIETLPRRGYRLVAPLATVAAPPPRADDGAATETQPASVHIPRRSALRWVTGAAIALIVGVGFAVWRLIPPTLDKATPVATLTQGSLDRSLAVPPFSVLGADADATIYAEALTEELRAALTRYRELRTVSIPDATEPHDVDQASYVLDGSLQHMGDHLRVRARLIRTVDDQDVWARSFESPLADTSLDTAELATTMGRYVRLQLVLDQECETVRRMSRSEEAAHAYCSALTQVYQGLQVGHIDPRLQLSAAQHALALDSEIVGAYHLVARSYQFMGGAGLMDWRDARRNAYAAVNEGLARAPDSPRLLARRGRLQRDFDLDYTGAEASFQAALASDPLHPDTYRVYVALSRLATQRGDSEGARKHARRALRVDDSDPDSHTTYAGALFFAGELEDVIAAADAGLRLVQTGIYRFYLLWLKALSHAGLGEMVEANAAMDEALASVGPGYKVGLAAPLARLGRLSEAHVLLTQLEAMSDPPIELMANAYAALDKDRAFEWIHRAIDRRIGPLVQTLRLSPTYAELRKDPRWDDVMAHLEAEEAKGRAGGGAPG